MSNYVFIATSLDGFIADKNGDIDWLMEIPNPDKTDYGYGDFMEGIDALVMGRNTFDKILSFDEWPYTKPVFVLSSSLTEIPKTLIGKVEIVQGDISCVIQDLNQKGYKNLYIDGGQVIQAFLNKDLIDELIINRIPILLGGGVPLFGDMNQRLKFKHTKTDVLNNSHVMSYYSRDKESCQIT